MFNWFAAFAGELGALFAGVAAGMAWVACVIAPNVSYDRLDAARADGHVRQLLLSMSTATSGLLLASTAFSVLAFNFGAGICAGLAAFGFFTNRWTLAPKKKGEAPPHVRQSRKTQRRVAVSFSLMFTLVAVAAAVLGTFGI